LLPLSFAQQKKRGGNMLQRASLFTALFIFWLALSGHYTIFHTAAGAISAALIVWFAERRLKVLDLEGHAIHLTLRAITYWPWLIWEICKAAWDVTKITLRPTLPISPQLFKTKATQKTDLGRVIYANSITLTPGTISIDLEGKSILVHALTKAGADGVESGDMDRRVTHFEGNT
jgi:multicomponent Na+:H+ antiporter subunit E